MDKITLSIFLLIGLAFGVLWVIVAFAIYTLAKKLILDNQKSSTLPYWQPL